MKYKLECAFDRHDLIGVVIVDAKSEAEAEEIGFGMCGEWYTESGKPFDSGTPVDVVATRIESKKEVDAEKPAISKMSRKGLIDLAIQIEGGDTGRSFEESAKYWADQDDPERADLFTAIANRWWELEERGYEETEPIAKIRNINPAWGDSIEFADVDEMAMSIEMCDYELPEDGLVEGRDYERISTAD